MDVIKNQIAELGMTEQCTFCLSREEATEKALEVIEAAIAEKPTSEKEIRPIDFIILDPGKNGFEVVKSVHSCTNNKRDAKIIGPRYVFLTDNLTETLSQ